MTLKPMLMGPGSIAKRRKHENKNSKIHDSSLLNYLYLGDICCQLRFFSPKKINRNTKENFGILVYSFHKSNSTLKGINLES